MKPYEGKEPYIFVSYAHKDKDWVIPTINVLSEKGYRIWFDEGIELGSEYPQYIGEHLLNAHIFLAFITENSVNSRYCRKEISLADSHNKCIIAIYINENLQLPQGLELQIGNTQAMYYSRYRSFDEFINTLSTARELKDCLGFLGEGKRKSPLQTSPLREDPKGATITSPTISSSERRGYQGAQKRKKVPTADDPSPAPSRPTPPVPTPPTSPSPTPSRSDSSRLPVIDKDTLRIWSIVIFSIAIGFSIIAFFISREFAFIGLGVLVLGSIVGTILAIISDNKAILYVAVSVAAITLCSLLPATFYVWGTNPVGVNEKKGTVVYYLDRSRGTHVVEYQENGYILKRIDSPNADYIVVEEGYKQIESKAIQYCYNVKSVYLPSSMEIIQSNALVNANLTTLYIGYNEDGTKSEKTSQLKCLENQGLIASSIKTIYYNGTVKEWNAVDKPTIIGNWSGNFTKIKVVCNDGESTFN